ncbi:hypothetical protein ACO9S2_09240 [Nitrospira sp. NS4]|uniref:hypothetical protein n=1 Tax=Nitrospira sp. NS4 TaxID=3414498 RepID=UPI003C2F9155
MSDSPTPADPNRTEPPLWSIGIAVLVILLAPLLLYSLAPSGPLREGDTVFSEGHQRALVSVHDLAPAPDKVEICLLDPGTPLIIVQPPGDRPDGTILATVQGNVPIEWPFCRAHTEVLLTTQQVFQKPDPLAGIKDRFAGLLGR